LYSFRLPEALQSSDDEPPLDYLRRYYRESPGTRLGTDYTGARFDTWDSSGTRADATSRFTADDLVAVTFLSVTVPPQAAWELLTGRPDDFNKPLAEVPKVDLADVEPAEINESWPAWQLWNELRRLRGIGPVIASKLLARKRPQLIPIYDRFVKNTTGGDPNFWVPLCQALRADNKALHNRLLRLHRKAGLPYEVSALRVFDVIAWMEGKRQKSLSPLETANTPAGGISYPQGPAGIFPDSPHPGHRCSLLRPGEPTRHTPSGR
jgi:hypothetical protein